MLVGDEALVGENSWMTCDRTGEYDGMDVEDLAGEEPEPMGLGVSARFTSSPPALASISPPALPSISPPALASEDLRRCCSLDCASMNDERGGGVPRRP